MSKKKDDYQENSDRIQQEIKQDEGNKEFFEPYEESSVNSFIQQYAHHKSMLITFGSSVKRSRESILDDWQKGAWTALEEIQHKKLFDLSCKWQMGDIKSLPQIDTTMDFKLVGRVILDYEGVPDITPEEIGIYSRFLNSGIVLEYYSFRHEYQDYDELHEQYNADLKTGIPYYDFHNQLTNNTALRYYGGLRQKKEEEYIQIADDHKPKAVPTPEKKVKVKKYLSSSDEDLIKFARKHNEIKLAAYIEEMQTYWREEHDEQAEWAFRYLKDAFPEKVPIAAHENWTDAILNGALAHKQKKIGEFLPSIYEEYLFKKSAGITFYPPGSHEERHGFRLWYRNMILEGRELNGETRNFDF